GASFHCAAGCDCTCLLCRWSFGKYTRACVVAHYPLGFIHSSRANCCLALCFLVCSPLAGASCTAKGFSTHCDSAGFVLRDMYVFLHSESGLIATTRNCRNVAIRTCAPSALRQ